MSTTFRRFYWSLLCFMGLITGLSAQEVVATIPMEQRHRKTCVPVMLNGQGPFMFAIDTGTGGDAVVSAELARKLGLKVTGEDEIGDPTGVNRQKVPVYGIDSLKLGGVEFKDVHATQLTEMEMGQRFDGILGFVLFRDYLLTLDFPKQEVKLLRGALPAADGNQIIHFRMPDNVPLIELNIGGQDVGTHVDTGGMGLSLPEKIAKNLTFVSEPVVMGRGRTVSNDFEIKGAQMASEIKLGGYTFPKPFVEINPVFPMANFGAIPLANFAVTFDQKNQRVRFLAADKTVVLAPPRFGGPMQPQARPASDGASPKH